VGLYVAVGVVLLLAFVHALRPRSFLGRFLRQLVLGVVRLVLGISIGR
jgi:hypothetical protein